MADDEKKGKVEGAAEKTGWGTVKGLGKVVKKGFSNKEEEK